MLTHPFVEQVKTLRCQGMIDALQEQLETPNVNQ